MIIFKLSLAIFLACVCLRWWISDQLLIDILRISAGVASVSLPLDK